MVVFYFVFFRKPLMFKGRHSLAANAKRPNVLVKGFWFSYECFFTCEEDCVFSVYVLQFALWELLDWWGKYVCVLCLSKVLLCAYMKAHIRARFCHMLKFRKVEKTPMHSLMPLFIGWKVLALFLLLGEIPTLRMIHYEAVFGVFGATFNL